MKKEFKYDINEEFGTEIISEGGNSFLAMRKISWNGGNEKLDIRKYLINSEGNEIMGKGVSITDEDANTLVNLLIDKGYGNPKTIIESLSNNDVAVGAMVNVINNKDENYINKCVDAFRRIESDQNDDEGFNADELFD